MREARVVLRKQGERNYEMDMKDYDKRQVADVFKLIIFCSLYALIPEIRNLARGSTISDGRIACQIFDTILRKQGEGRKEGRRDPEPLTILAGFPSLGTVRRGNPSLPPATSKEAVGT
jgi:hypothetical protein